MAELYRVVVPELHLREILIWAENPDEAVLDAMDFQKSPSCVRRLQDDELPGIKTSVKEYRNEKETD